MRLLVIDTETGGLDPQVHSILSLGAVVYPYEPSVNEFSEFVLERPVVVDTKALEVNRINLVEHSTRALSPEKAWEKFLLFVNAQPGLFKLFGRVVLAGHNIPFDIGFLRRLHRLSGDQTPFDGYFSHRFVDTMAVGVFMQLCGYDGKVGLKDLLPVFWLTNGAEHTALGDARATAMLLEAMRQSASFNFRKGVA